MTLTDKLQEAIDKIAPERSANHRKPIPPWISAEIHLLASKRDATDRRYVRCGSPQLLIELAKEVEERSENARSAHMHSRISDALDSGKNF